MNYKKHLAYYNKDRRGEIWFLLRSLRIWGNLNVWTYINRLICKLKGIRLEDKSSFMNKTYFCRHPLSCIRIGSSCSFNSMPIYNLIGINHKCMVSTLTTGATIEIGNNCGFSGTVIGAFKSIKIGNNVRCGANTLITDSDWHLDDARSGMPKDVFIDDNVWLGVNCIVLKGVRIGENSVIGANSVITKSIPANVVAAGNPCKILKNLNVE